MHMINSYLDDVKADLDRAACEAEKARAVYNQRMKECKTQKVRYDRLKFVALEEL
jgi:hypothetical protein